jgi:16S rRNA (cytidine1402-2'-O)-methyltransferase
VAASSQTGSLYVVSTPIGNLEDISLRALRVLREVSLIAAEDTRRTRGLLTHYQIRTALTSYHDHNKHAKAPVLVAKLEGGQDVAIVSDSGTPGVSDPAYHLVQQAIRAGIRVVPVPGASALLSALVAGGLPTDRFVFEGFLPAKAARRRHHLERLKTEGRTIILYESPHRIEAALRDMLSVLGDRRVVLARELTKVFEEIRRGTLSEILLAVSEARPRGEMVLVVEGRRAE